MQQLEQDIKTWADSRWPTRTLASRLRKLGEEVGELSEAVAEQWEQPSGRATVLEAADCAIVLSDICSMLGYSLSAVMREKFAEVQARPHENGRLAKPYVRGRLCDNMNCLCSYPSNLEKCPQCGSESGGLPL